MNTAGSRLLSAALAELNATDCAVQQVLQSPEEHLAALLQQHVHSPDDLPVCVAQTPLAQPGIVCSCLRTHRKPFRWLPAWLAVPVTTHPSSFMPSAHIILAAAAATAAAAAGAQADAVLVADRVGLQAVPAAEAASQGLSTASAAA